MAHMTQTEKLLIGMSMEAILSQEIYRRLKRALINCKIGYYNQAESFVCDEVYDKAEERCVKLEAHRPEWVVYTPIAEMAGIDPGLRCNGPFDTLEKQP